MARPPPAALRGVRAVPIAPPPLPLSLPATVSIMRFLAIRSNLLFLA